MQYPARDVAPSDPFAMTIWRMYEAGVTTGFPDGTYRPLAPISREAMAAFLFRAQQRGGKVMPACDPTKPRVFTDVTADHPFCGAIEWLAANGVSTGWADHTYRPSEPVSREAMAAFRYRFGFLM